MLRFLNRILFIMLLFSTIFIFSFNSFAARRFDCIKIKYYNVPESAVYVDILVPEISDNVFYNDTKTDFDIFPSTAEIINYKDSDGFVSLTFNYDVYYEYSELLINGNVYFSADFEDILSKKYKVKNNRPYNKEEVYISLSNAYDYYDGIKYNSLEYFELLNSIPGEYRVELSSFFLFDSNRYVNNSTFKDDFKCFKLAFLDEEGNILATSNKCDAIDMQKTNSSYICDGTELVSRIEKSKLTGALRILAIICMIAFSIFIINLIFFILDIRYICILKEHNLLEDDSQKSFVVINVLLWFLGAGLIANMYNVSTFIRYRKILKKNNSYKPEIENLF